MSISLSSQIPSICTDTVNPYGIMVGASSGCGRGQKVKFDGHSPDAIPWFKRWRSLLRRHGHHQTVLDALAALVRADLAQGEDLETVQQVQAYFHTHRQHIRYHSFQRQQYPLGSGMIESACKWLIQQRFKGVGMRWSEDGFNHLLHLRLDWVNHRFDSLFPHVSIQQLDPSHNR